MYNNQILLVPRMVSTHKFHCNVTNVLRFRCTCITGYSFIFHMKTWKASAVEKHEKRMYLSRVVFSLRQTVVLIEKWCLF